MEAALATLGALAFLMMVIVFWVILYKAGRAQERHAERMAAIAAKKEV